MFYIIFKSKSVLHVYTTEKMHCMYRSTRLTFYMLQNNKVANVEEVYKSRMISLTDLRITLQIIPNNGRR